MVAAWETLFHLSNFMKHLLLEVLPNEKVDCPKYVMDSLFDLLNITLECINLVRSRNGQEITSLRKTFHKDIENSVTASLECYGSNMNNHAFHTESHENIQSDILTQNVEEINHESLSQNDVDPENYNSTKFDHIEDNGRAANENKTPSKTLHKCTVITQQFLTLNDEILAGKPSGYYCLPCDCCFSTDDEWENHINSRKHMDRIKKQQCQEYFCERCNLVVFGNVLITPVYLDFHCQMHHRISSSNVSSESLTTAEFPNTESSQLQNQLSECPELKKKQISPKDLNDFVTPTFNKIHQRVIKGFREYAMFYCYFCDKKCFSAGQWTKHLNKMHSTESENQISKELLKMCEVCTFTIYAPPNLLNEMMKYHLDCHYTLDKEKDTKSANIMADLKNSSRQASPSMNITQLKEYYENDEISRSTSVSELNENSINLSTDCKYASETDISKEKVIPTNRNTKKNYEISKKFISFNTTIHNQNLRCAYYCRPCDECCSPEQWEEHCIRSKHISFMDSKIFKNFQGECAYCMLTIIGTERTVNEYMKYHNEMHKKVLSFSCEEIIHDTNDSSQKKTQINYTKPKKNRKKKLNQAVGDSVSKINDENIESSVHVNSGSDLYEDNYSYESQNNLNSKATVDSSLTIKKAAPDEKSWYESVLAKLTDMYNLRKKEKFSHNEPSFGGFCIPCEVIIENGFEWIDHLIDDEHLKRKGNNDIELSFSNLSMTVFGNVDVIPPFILNEK